MSNELLRNRYTVKQIRKKYKYNGIMPKMGTIMCIFHETIDTGTNKKFHNSIYIGHDAWGYYPFTIKATDL